MLKHLNDANDTLSHIRYREPPFFNTSTCNVIYITVNGHVCNLNHIIQDVIQFMSCFLTYFYVRVLFYTHHFHCNGNCFRHSKRHYYFYLEPSHRYGEW